MRGVRGQVFHLFSVRLSGGAPLVRPETANGILTADTLPHTLDNYPPDRAPRPIQRAHIAYTRTMEPSSLPAADGSFHLTGPLEPLPGHDELAIADPPPPPSVPPPAPVAKGTQMLHGSSPRFYFNSPPSLALPFDSTHSPM